MPVGQLSAGFLAGLLLFMALIGFLRYPRPVMVAILGLLLAIPAAGLAAYAVVPGPPASPGPLLWLAFVPALAGLGAGIWMLMWMAARRTSLTAPNIEFLSNGFIVAFAGGVLAISDVLAIWEPPFAIANLAANAAWVCVWIPRRSRETSAESSIDIAAPRSRVYAYIAEPSNWARYQEDVESVTLSPDGPLAVGSRVVVRQRYASHVRGPRILPQVIESALVIIELVPNTLIAAQMANRSFNTSLIEFAEAGEVTRIFQHSRSVLPFRSAVFGVMIELRSGRADRVARSQRNLARLKALLESPAAASV